MLEAKETKKPGDEGKGFIRKKIEQALRSLSGKKEEGASSQTSIAKVKAESREITNGLQDNATETETKLKALPKEQITMPEAKQNLSEAAATTRGREVMKLLQISESDLIHSPNAAALVARIAAAPQELQNDPHYLMAEGAKLFWSTQWASIPHEEHMEIRKVLVKIRERVEVLRSSSPDFAHIEQDTVQYALVPEARMGMARRGPRGVGGTVRGEDIYREVTLGLDAQIASLPKEYRGYLEQAIVFIKSPDVVINRRNIDRHLSDLDTMRRKYKGDPKKPQLTAAQERLIDEIHQRLERADQKLDQIVEQKNYVPNKIYINPEIAVKSGFDPIGISDGILDEALVAMFESGEGSATAKQALERLDQLQYVLFDPSFDIRRVEIMTPDGRAFTPQEQSDLMENRRIFLNAQKHQKERFARDFTIRHKTARFWGPWKDAAGLDDKRLLDYINYQSDEDDFFGLDGCYGALVGRFRRACAINYENMILDEHGQARGYDPVFFQRAIDRTIGEFEKSTRNRDRFIKYRKGEFLKERVGSTDEGATFEPKLTFETPEEEKAHWDKEWKLACRSIGHLGKVRMIMSFEKFNIDSRFAAPKWSQSQRDIASDFLEKQKISRLSHLYENNLMQWNTTGLQMTELERANIRHRAEIMLETMPGALEHGTEWAHEMWDRIEMWKRGGLSPEEQKVLFGQIDGLFYFTPDPLNRPPDPSSGKKDTQMGEWIRKLKWERLEKETQIYTGMRLNQRFNYNPYYMMWESGYRRSVFNRALSNTLALTDKVAGKIGGTVERKMDGVFDAGRIVGAYTTYNYDLTSGNIHGAETRLLNEIAPVAHTRPHDLIFALKEGHSSSLRQPGVEAELVGDHEGGFMGAYHEIALSFEEIRDGLLERTFHTQIDYYRGLTGLDGVQREVATQWFREKYGDNADQQMQWYFGSMERMSKYLLGPNPNIVEPHPHLSTTKEKLRYILLGNIGQKEQGLPFGHLKDLANPGYIPMLSKGRWDDYPYEWLQEPGRILGMIDPKGEHVLSQNMPSLTEDMPRLEEEILRLTQQLSSVGDEQSGEWRRMMRDGANAQGAAMFEADTMGDDDKKYLEATQKKNSAMAGYQGGDAAALSTDVAAAARLRTMKVKPGYGPFLEKMKGACEMSQYGPPNFKALSADEAHTKLNESRGKTFGNAMNVPSIERVLEVDEAVAGISNWDKVFKVLGYIPVVGQATRALEVSLGHARWGRLKERLNSTFATGVIKHKGILTVPFVILAIGAVIIAELSRSDGGEGKSKPHP